MDVRVGLWRKLSAEELMLLYFCFYSQYSGRWVIEDPAVIYVWEFFAYVFLWEFYTRDRNFSLKNTDTKSGIVRNWNCCPHSTHSPGSDYSSPALSPGPACAGPSDAPSMRGTQTWKLAGTPSLPSTFFGFILMFFSHFLTWMLILFCSLIFPFLVLRA